MAWSWNLKRAALSALILAHLAAVLLWNLPECALRQRLAGWTAYYLLPTGQWQGWNMFSPDPVRETVALCAVVRDARGMFYNYDFPRMATRSRWEALWGFRHSKFVANLAPDSAVAYREFAARHILRDLGLPPRAFPADVELDYQLWPAPPLGSGPTDSTDPPQRMVLQVYRFPTFEEAQP